MPNSAVRWFTDQQKYNLVGSGGGYPEGSETNLRFSDFSISGAVERSIVKIMFKLATIKYAFHSVGRSFRKDKKGFTLIETFVAITILLIGILGPMTAIGKFYADSSFAKNQIAAAFFAQDGMETAINILRNGRLTYLQNNPDVCTISTDNSWMGDLANCVYNKCNVDPLTGKVLTDGNSFVYESDGTTPKGFPLYKNKDTASNPGFYTAYADSSNNDPTNFYRTITATVETSDSPATDDGANLRSIDISSKVVWTEKGNSHPIEINTRIIENPCH